MTRGVRIPVRDEARMPEGVGSGLDAIVAEIKAMLQRLLDGGEGGQIDLQSLPLARDEYARLKTLLGEGEARIELNLNGVTRCQETGLPAVWWVEHHNPGGTIAAEFVEVATVPDILKYDEDEIREGITRLGQQLVVDGSTQEESKDE